MLVFNGVFASGQAVMRCGYSCLILLLGRLKEFSMSNRSFLEHSQLRFALFPCLRWALLPHAGITRIKIAAFE